MRKADLKLLATFKKLTEDAKKRVYEAATKDPDVSGLLILAYYAELRRT